MKNGELTLAGDAGSGTGLGKGSLSLPSSEGDIWSRVFMVPRKKPCVRLTDTTTWSRSPPAHLCHERTGSPLPDAHLLMSPIAAMLATLANFRNNCKFQAKIPFTWSAVRNAHSATRA
ncbi:hypothetical protein E2C01_040987 [Portunus trituberculatus]|uniref:Uncharacterized protein n=1 Tax=Portunus trituberculatus TaxID=210409 RepID=A0A5B7FP63_PORTR|nr:hypothetical protein [Portunus trituberculatus]